MFGIVAVGGGAVTAIGTSRAALAVTTLGPVTSNSAFQSPGITNVYGRLYVPGGFVSGIVRGISVMTCGRVICARNFTLAPEIGSPLSRSFSRTTIVRLKPLPRACAEMRGWAFPPS